MDDYFEVVADFSHIHYDAKHYEHVCEWVKSLGLDPSTLGPRAQVIRIAGQHEFHGWQTTDAENFSYVYNLAEGKPVVVQVEPNSWPVREHAA